MLENITRHSQSSLLTQLDPEMLELLVQCESSTKALASLFMPETFSRKFSPPHEEIFSVLDDDSIPLLAILAPRGIGKTSIVSKPFLIRNILFQKRRHIIYVSKSNSHATDQTENLKFELTTNDYFKKFFGSIESDRFARDSWITSTGIKVVPRGSGQQIRGLLHRNDRPDLIVVDDLEDAELVLNEDYREKQWEWFNSDLLHSIDRGRPGWRIVVIGTMLHERSLLARIHKEERKRREEGKPASWRCIKLRIWDEAQQSLWPEFMPTAEIHKIYDELKDRGLADSFAREYNNDPISRTDGSFQEGYFQYYTEADFNRKGTETFVLVDPAKSVNPKADYSAIVCVSFDSAQRRVYVRDLKMERLYPDELYASVVEMARRYKASAVGLEVTSLNEFIKQPFKNYMSQYNNYFELVELKARGNMKKVDRIRALIPYYRMGQVYHNANGVCSPLEEQLLSFPRSEYDDAMDALAYFIEMLEVGGRYMIADQPEDSDPEDVYRKLEEQEALEPIYAEEWMVA